MSKKDQRNIRPEENLVNESRKLSRNIAIKNNKNKNASQINNKSSSSSSSFTTNNSRDYLSREIEIKQSDFDEETFFTFHPKTNLAFPFLNSISEPYNQQVNNSDNHLRMSLVGLKDLTGSEFDNLFVSKLKHCQTIIPLNDESAKTMSLLELKRENLIDILHYVTENADATFPLGVYRDIIEMFKLNCFRQLSPNAISTHDEEDVYNEPAWPMLQIVYDIFLRFLETTDFQPAEAKKYIDQVFIFKLLDLFETDDPRERECLKTILHRIYGRLISVRSTIRKGINHIFARFIYETDRHNGIAELLEILGSIVNGFQVPLKREHVKFLENFLLPLHKGSSLCRYHPQLAYCIIEYIHKDKTLLPSILQQGILKFWPKTASGKEIMFLNELEEIIDASTQENWLFICKNVFPKLAIAANSPHFQVAERTLFFWINSNFQNILRNNYKMSLDAFFPSLYHARQHWNKNIQSLAFNALKIMMDMNPTEFTKSSDNYRDSRRREKEYSKEREKKWSKVKKMADQSLARKVLPKKNTGSTIEKSVSSSMNNNYERETNNNKSRELNNNNKAQQQL